MSASSSATRYDPEQAGTTKVTPLLSEEGKDFLEGRLDAEEYMEEGRRRIEDQAIKQVSERVPFNLPWQARIAFLALSFIAYALLAVLAFVQSENTAGVIALVTSLAMVFLAGVIYGRSRRISSRRSRLVP